jgi:hypothetical protein
MKAVLLTAFALFVVGCNLAGLDETNLTVSSSQDNTRIVAILDSDTLLNLEGSGSLSAPVEAGDSVTIFIYVYDISGELLLYNTRGFSIEEGRCIRYSL